MDFFWLSRLLVSPSTSSGFLRKVWMPGSMTVGRSRVVAVQELGDRLGRADELDRLLLQAV